MGHKSLTIQIFQHSGLGDKGTALVPEQDVILRAAPSVGPAVQPRCGTPAPSLWLCHMSRVEIGGNIPWNTPSSQG